MATTTTNDIGLKSASSVKQSSKARALILGAAKIGKTVALAGTAPKPLVLLADGQSATKGALEIYGDRFFVQPFVTVAEIRAGMALAKKAAAAGAIESIIVDSLTVLAWRVLDELESGPKKLEGFELWGEYRNYLEKTVIDLFALDVHVFLVGHLTPGMKAEPGELPGIAGSAKTRIPAIIDDWIGFTYEPGRKPHERAFLVGPQKNWDYGSRGLAGRESMIVEPTVPALLKALHLAA